MANKRNHQKKNLAKNQKRTENGPRWENSDPGAGCNSTHVARSRRQYQDLCRRKHRRQVKQYLQDSLKEGTDHDEIVPDEDRDLTL